MQEVLLHESSTAAVEKKEVKEHPAMPALTWQSIAEGLGEIFKGNMVRSPVDVSFSNITYTASLGFRKGERVSRRAVFLWLDRL